MQENHGPLELEWELNRRIQKRRRMTAVICVISALVMIAFAVAYEQSRTVKEVGEGIFHYTSITYNYNLSFGILAGALVFIPAVLCLITDCLFCRVATVEVSGHYVTLYRGPVDTKLYIDGECADELFLFGYYLEGTLPGGAKVNVALGKWSAHITFSNGWPSVDV